MSRIQRFFQWLLPERWAADMEVKSRAWMLRCNQCGHERSVWEMGGIRWKAVGNPKHKLVCPICGQAKWHTVVYRNGSTTL